jgi:hypothetical protein
MKARKKKNQSSRLAKKENIFYKQTNGFHTRWSIGVVSVRYFDLTHPKDDVTRWRPIATYVASTPTHSREGLSTVEVQLGISQTNNLYYIRTSGVSDECDDTAYPSSEAAISAAVRFAKERSLSQGR